MSCRFKPVKNVLDRLLNWDLLFDAYNHDKVEVFLKRRKNSQLDVLVSFPKSICILTHPVGLFSVKTNDIL